jgi:hypothetical protein
MPATLRMTREPRPFPIELRRGRFEILVDDKPVGSLENHDAAETEIEPGRHHLTLRKGRYSSRTRSFDAADGEVVGFRCSGTTIWFIYLASIVKPDLAISLKRG